MAKTLVLGAGVMGSAFSLLLADCGHEVNLVGTHLDGDIIRGIRQNAVHPKLGVKLPNGVVPLTHDQLGEALRERPDLIVFGVNSAGVKWANQQMGQWLRKSIPIIMLTKGLAVRNGEIVILPQVVRQDLQRFGIEDVPVGAVAGPCIAGELAARRDSSVVITHPDAKLLDWLLDLVSVSYYHARPNTDIVGVEVCAALKNFYAIGVGYANGRLKLEGRAQNDARMHNLSAGLFVQALLEIRYFLGCLGGEAESVFGLAGAGDLYVTCQGGRNSRLGQFLGAGLSYSEAKNSHMAEDTIEGAELALTIAPALTRLLNRQRLERAALPLGLAIMDAVCDDIPMQIPWDRFYAAA
jgi:glycerol-3-phosphate dehydrogenase (NAD(P)+)